MAFTQAELREAYKQMEAERRIEKARAQLAAEILSAHVGTTVHIDFASSYHDRFVGVTPEAISYKLVIYNDNNDPTWYENKLVAAGVSMGGMNGNGGARGVGWWHVANIPELAALNMILVTIEEKNTYSWGDGCTT